MSNETTDFKLEYNVINWYWVIEKETGYKVNHLKGVETARGEMEILQQYIDNLKAKPRQFLQPATKDPVPECWSVYEIRYDDAGDAIVKIERINTYDTLMEARSRVRELAHPYPRSNPPAYHVRSSENEAVIYSPEWSRRTHAYKVILGSITSIDLEEGIGYE